MENDYRNNVTICQEEYEFGDCVPSLNFWLGIEIKNLGSTTKSWTLWKACIEWRVELLPQNMYNLKKAKCSNDRNGADHSQRFSLFSLSIQEKKFQNCTKSVENLSRCT